MLAAFLNVLQNIQLRHISGCGEVFGTSAKLGWQKQTLTVLQHSLLHLCLIAQFPDTFLWKYTQRALSLQDGLCERG